MLGPQIHGDELEEETEENGDDGAAPDFNFKEQVDFACCCSACCVVLVVVLLVLVVVTSISCPWALFQKVTEEMEDYELFTMSSMFNDKSTEEFVRRLQYPVLYLVRDTRRGTSRSSQQIDRATRLPTREEALHNILIRRPTKNLRFLDFSFSVFFSFQFLVFVVFRNTVTVRKST
jgi:hypothetical protein